MKHLKLTIGVLGLASCAVTLYLYYWHRSNNYHQVILKKVNLTPRMVDDEAEGTPMRHVPLDEIYKDSRFGKNRDSSEENWDEVSKATLIDTPGCQIPLVMINFYKHMNRNKTAYCGSRAVFLEKTGTDKVNVLIKINKIKKYLRKTVQFYCCYRFIKPKEERDKIMVAMWHVDLCRKAQDRLMKVNDDGYCFMSYIARVHNNINHRYTKCKKIVSGDSFALKAEFVNVKCYEFSSNKNNSREIYDDVYAFIKKKSKPDVNNRCNKKRYNVLMLGMDSMSLVRFAQTMPRTAKFFRDNFWLGYRGYNKVGDNTFPNLMAALTGKNLSTISKMCANRMDKCNDLLIWSQFSMSGYVTAYGEDYLRLPDTFSRDYAFQKWPTTDHFIKPLFLTGEKERNSTVCSGKVPAGQQLLDYAFDFAVTYRSESFFGLFWMNSFSHNIHSRSENADVMFENFFNRLSYTGILDNTFLIFFSDHGVRFGTHRMSAESYYDERLPMLFIHVPLYFKSRYFEKLKSLSANQYRLTTPYDLYNTLVEIHRLSECNDIELSQSTACPLCHSMFNDISPNRTCSDVSIHQKWCSCHKLYPLEIKDNEGVKSVMQMVRHIQNITSSVKTKPCWSCMALTFKNIIRIHFYFDKRSSSMYHVIAFTMHPGNVSYEATVLKKGEKVQLVGSLSVISPYKGLGKCTVDKKDRLFCVCQEMSNCKRRSNI